MDQLVLFIQANWQNIVTIAIALATLLITILKKRVKVIDSIKESILDRLPCFIAAAEKMFDNGQEKKNYVMSVMCGFLKRTFGCSVGDYIDFISDSIESILATPQKKGE